MPIRCRRIPPRTARPGWRRRSSCSRGSWTSACRWISKGSRMTKAWGAVAFAALLTLTACKQAAAPSPAHSPVPDRQVTFNEQIAPILFEHCASCHRPIDGSPPRTASNDPKDPLCVAGAPFSLLDYPSARAHAREIATATATRAMPPWLPEPDVHFANERRLRDEQIALIQRWVERGTPEGDAS